MPRFAILEHDHPELHWDLLLEAGDTLRTWRLAAPPTDTQPIAATRLPDHRRLYLDYEGAVSGGRGVVRAWERGTFNPELPATEEHRLLLRLCGQRLNANALLQRQEGVAWLFQLLGEEASVSSPPVPSPPEPALPR